MEEGQDYHSSLHGEKWHRQRLSRLSVLSIQRIEILSILSLSFIDTERIFHLSLITLSIQMKKRLDGVALSVLYRESGDLPYSLYKEQQSFSLSRDREWRIALFLCKEECRQSSFVFSR